MAEQYTPRLKEQYRKEIAPKLIQSGKYKNRMQLPRLTKISLSCSVKDALLNPKALEALANDISQIAGQKAMLTKSRNAIANFKLREGINLGCVVTLRGEKMYEFLDRFITVAAPRVRDFRGYPKKSFDGRGNYSFGIKEHTIFPEVDYNTVEKIRGFNITIGTTAESDEEALNLLKDLGFPFRN